METGVECAAAGSRAVRLRAQSPVKQPVLRERAPDNIREISSDSALPRQHDTNPITVSSYLIEPLFRFFARKQNSRWIIKHSSIIYRSKWASHYMTVFHRRHPAASPYHRSDRTSVMGQSPSQLPEWPLTKSNWMWSFDVSVLSQDKCVKSERELTKSQVCLLYLVCLSI